MIGLVLAFLVLIASKVGKTMNRAMNNPKFGISSVLFAEWKVRSSEMWRRSHLD